MSRHAFSLSILFLLFTVSITLSCGSGRQIQSITVAPASADAQDYPDGQVPFVATGHYNSSPTTVTSLPADWGAIEPGVPAGAAVTVNSNGTAQCAAGTSGTFLIGAWVNLPAENPPMCLPNPFGSSSCAFVLGTAKLTCP
jgi:hypothetical protein